MVGIALFWIVLAGAYLALVGSLSAVEGVAALVCGGLGAVWVRQLARCGDRDVRIRAGALLPVLPVLARLPVETWKVGARLTRAALRGDVAGQDRAVPPSEAAGCPSRDEDPYGAGACAVSVLAASLSPDSYVLRLEPERGRVLLHAILPEKGLR